MNKKALFVIILLASAQFILTLDSTFMNVSISTLVKDLNTTVTAIQGAIAFYTLVMGSLMIAGAKIGDIIGRRKAFTIGLIIYGVGSLITSLSQNIQTLIFGWSFLEGVGAALIIPAMLSMVASNYEKPDTRAQAYGILAAMAAIGAAVGPIVGGFLTTYLSWRLGFLAEVLVVIFILIFRNRINDALVTLKDKRFDYVGLFLSVFGLATIVVGILTANTYGLVIARKDFVINGQVLIQQGSLAPIFYFVVVGLAIMAFFLYLESHHVKNGKPSLLDPIIFKTRTVKYGVITMLPFMLVMGGVMFLVSIISQIILEYSAIQSGLVLFPLSLSVLIFALLGNRFKKFWSVKAIIQIGMLTMVVGSVLLGFINYHHPSTIDFVPSLILVGAGVGMVASQLQNLIISSVSAEKSSEASGLSMTGSNIGMSFGTAISGALILAGFVFFATNMINASTVFTQSQKDQLDNVVATKAQTLSNAELSTYISGQPQDVQNEILTINTDALNKAASTAAFGLAILGATGLVSSALLTKKKTT